MLVRHVRIAFLAVAAWAVLFAPGVLGGADAADTSTHSERVGAAVMAPTFNDGPLLAQSGCRRAYENLNDCGAQIQWGLAPPVLLASSGVFATRLSQGHRRSAKQRLVRLFSRRGPPLS